MITNMNENRGDVGNTEKLEIFRFSWKVPRKLGNNILKLEIFTEVGKSQAKLERTERSWKEPIEVGKFELKLENSG